MRAGHQVCKKSLYGAKTPSIALSKLNPGFAVASGIKKLLKKQSKMRAGINLLKENIRLFESVNTGSLSSLRK